MSGPEPVPPQRPSERTQAYAILQSAERIDRLLADALRVAAPGAGVVGLTPALILCELERAGPARPTQLQAVSGLTSGGVTKTLDRLEAHGLIARRTNAVAGDRRGISVELTREGASVAAAIGAAILARAADLRAGADLLAGVLGPVIGR